MKYPRRTIAFLNGICIEPKTTLHTDPELAPLVNHVEYMSVADHEDEMCGLHANLMAYGTETSDYRERLQKAAERIETLKKALSVCADHAARETNGLKQYEGDTYGYISIVAKKALEDCK